MSHLLVRNSAITQSALVEHVTPYRQVVDDYAHQLNIITLSGRAALAQTGAAQAKAVAFIDSFKLMMLVSFLAIPLVIPVQRPSRQLGNQGSVSD
jgi:MFS transporter, DHA2 family, multidrug resistance protein